MKSSIIERHGRRALLGLACGTAIGLSGCVAYPYGDAYLSTGAYGYYPSNVYYGGGYGYYGPYYGGYYGGRCCYGRGGWDGHGGSHGHGGGGPWTSGGRSGGGGGGGGGGHGGGRH
ncbi:hypothetical protein [Pararobbsia alpina]|uniref:Uncharacterized protein n=1 Tax=Pararobbsia alpina TaxID=621374 RepID=A0A6S7BII0_9BURK|nr:hypothetical protein [Pararobbsia alpina]CAB3800734.1 hypothetical protein LMG28138_04915 [Pararobbsia alpina]